MPTVEEEIKSHQNMVSYALAVYKATKRVLELYKEGYTSLLNPSRGANPISLGIIRTANSFARDDPEARRFVDCIYTLGSNKPCPNDPFLFIPIPLTADITLDNDLIEQYKMFSDPVDVIRVYGSKVIKSLQMPPDQRKEDKYFRLMAWTFSELENRSYVRKFYSELPPIRKTIFVDTAISGRASRTIVEALNDSTIYPIIFEDEEGKRLINIHKDFFYKKQNQLKPGLDLIPMKRIVSEDQGAAFLGVYALFYPQIMLEAYKNFGFDYSSAVTWHSLDEDINKKFKEPYKLTFNAFMNLVTFLTNEMYETDKRVGGDLEHLNSEEVVDLLNKRDKIDEKIKTITNYIEEFGMPRTESVGTMKLEFYNGNMISKVHETRSHVVQIRLKEKYLKDKITSLGEELRSLEGVTI
jgi:hypothetical protein